MSIPAVLTIASSDSGSGAGIQADLKTFAAHEVYGTSVICAVTAQNSFEVTDIHPVPIETIRAQITAVMSDFDIRAVKTGMLFNTTTIEAVADELNSLPATPLVVDPVMVAKSGNQLLEETAVTALRERLIPLATVVTPNIPEAEVLVGRKLRSRDQLKRAAQEIRAIGARVVVIKGGHGNGMARDILFDGSDFHEFTSRRITTTSTHGTGCTFSAAILSGLATGLDVVTAVREAKKYVTSSLEAAFPMGHGFGPLHHFFRTWIRE